MVERETVDMADLEAEIDLLRAQEEQAKRAYPLLYFSVARRPSQRAFFADTNKVCALLSGNKAGKDYLLTHRLAIAYCRGKVVPIEMPDAFKPFEDMRSIREGTPLRTRYYMPDLKLWHTTIVPMLLGAIPYELRDGKKSSDGTGHNKSDSTIYTTDGGWVAGMSYTGFRQDEASSEGAELDFACLSEVSPHALFKQMLSRTLTTAGKVWLACTRNEKTCPYPMAWIRHEIIRAPKGSGISHYFLSTEENVTALVAELDEGGYPEAARQLRENWQQTKGMMTPEEIAVQLGGEWSGDASIVFGSFDAERHRYEVPDMTPAVFAVLAREGYGEIWCGMDHGEGHPTVVLYIFRALRPLSMLDIVEDDCIVFDEYYRANTKMIHHLPALQERQRQYQPKAYVCDPRMWGTAPQASPALLYTRPELLQGMMRGVGMECRLQDMTPIGPLRPGHNRVEVGIQVVAAMLAARPEPFAWPQLRILHVNGRCMAPMLVKALEEWQRKPNAAELSGEEKYSEHMKDPCDALRYFAMAVRGVAPQADAASEFKLPVDYNGIPLNMLAGLGMGGMA